MGDFNSIVNTHLDRTGNPRTNKKPNEVIRTLVNNSCIDTFRYIHPDTKTFTWSNKGNNAQPTVSTRIDHIWASTNLSNELILADIHDMSLITNSDHNTVSALFDTSYIIRNHKRSVNNRTGNPRIRYKYEEMTDEMWDNYAHRLDSLITNANLPHLQTNCHIRQIDINNIWSNLQRCFDTAAQTTIPKDKAITHNGLSPKKQMDNRPRHKVRMVRQLRTIINLSK